MPDMQSLGKMQDSPALHSAQLAQLGLAREVGGRQLAVAFLQLLLHAADVQFSGLLLH